MFVQRHEIAVTTDGSGDVTAYSEVPVYGRVLAIHYEKPGSNPLDAGADLVVTGEETGIPVLTWSNMGTASASRAPRQATHAVDDASASLYAAAGEPVEDYVFLAGERVKLVVASGGASKTGTFHVLIG